MSDDENPFGAFGGAPAVRRRSISSTGQPVAKAVKLESSHSDSGSSSHSELVDLNGKGGTPPEQSEQEEDERVAMLRTARKSLRPTPGKDLLKGLKIPPHHLAPAHPPKSAELPSPKVMPYPIRIAFSAPDPEVVPDVRSPAFLVRQRETGWTRRAGEVRDAWKDPTAFEEVLEAAKMIDNFNAGDSVFKEELHERTRKVTHDRLEAMEISVDQLINDLSSHLKTLEVFRKEIRAAKRNL